MSITNPTTGISTTYDLTTGIPVDMDEAIYLLSPLDAPMITGVNADGHQILPAMPTRNTSFDWMDETIATPRSALSGTITDADTTITVENTIAFEVGDLIKFDDPDNGWDPEVARVTAVVNSTDLTVEREWGGTSAAGHGGGSNQVYVVALGVLLPEGSDPGDSRTLDRQSHSNYTQIFGPSQVSMSRTEQGRLKYGVANEFTHQIMNRLREEVQRREFNVLYGVKNIDSGAGLRSSGGLAYWINQSGNVDSTSTALTVASIEALMETCYENGGIPDMLVSNPSQFGGLNDLDNTNRVRVDFADGRRGRQPVMEVFTEFGNVLCVRNRWCFKNNAILYTREQATRRVFDPVRLERLAKTGDSDNVQMVCEEGMMVKGPEHAGMFTNLATA